jgi:hypothetical protein
MIKSMLPYPLRMHLPPHPPPHLPHYFTLFTLHLPHYFTLFTAYPSLITLFHPFPYLHSERPKHCSKGLVEDQIDAPCQSFFSHLSPSFRPQHVIHLTTLFTLFTLFRTLLHTFATTLVTLFHAFPYLHSKRPKHCSKGLVEDQIDAPLPSSPHAPPTTHLTTLATLFHTFHTTHLITLITLFHAFPYLHSERPKHYSKGLVEDQIDAPRQSAHVPWRYRKHFFPLI